MKEKGLIAVLIIVAILVSGCGSYLNTKKSSSMIENSQSEESQIEQTTDSKFEDGEFQIISSYNGIIATAYAETPNGCYEVLYRPSGDGNIIYNDYATQKLIYLSEQPNTTHDNEADTSWIQSTNGGCYPVVGGDKLYLFKLNTPGFIDQLGEAGKGYIYQYNLDGSGKKALTKIDDNETVSGCCIAYDGNNLYYLSILVQEDGIESIYQIIQVNTETGEKTVIKELPIDERHYIVGAVGGSLILKHIINPINIQEGAEEADIKDMYSKQQHQVTICALDGEEKVVKEWNQDEISEMIYDNRMIYWDSKSGEIKSLNIFTLQEDVLISETPADVNGDKYDAITMLPDSYDNHILFNGENMVEDSESGEVYSETVQRLALNISTNEVIRLDLVYTDPLINDARDVSIYAEGADVFFVIVSKKEYAMTDYLEDGQLYITDLIVSVPAVIKKSDYWNNIPNYIEFQDYVYV